MYRPSKLYILVALAAAGNLAHAAAAADTGQQSQVKSLTGEKYIKDARVTLTQARTIALKAHPGKITDEELEKENGGSGLRYSFDIKDSIGTHEVGVDAKTGKVLENKLEGPDAD